MARIAIIIALLAFTAALIVGIPMMLGILLPFTGAVIVTAFPVLIVAGFVAMHAVGAEVTA